MHNGHFGKLPALQLYEYLVFRCDLYPHELSGRMDCELDIALGGRHHYFRTGDKDHRRALDGLSKWYQSLSISDQRCGEQRSRMHI